MFIGLSMANIVTQAMLKTMAADPIVFAMANPDPEIAYNLACSARKDIIMATGRSDHPNQVNNVLGFPFIFRGALDVRATKINEEMKMAAVKALADLAKEPVPEQVNIAYGKTRLTFGKDYIIPKPFDPRLISEVPPAVALAAMQSGVATQPIKDWEGYKDQLRERLGSDNKLLRLLLSRAKTDPKKVVLAEADHLDVLKAAQIVHDEGIAIPVLLGRKDIIEELKKEIGFDADVQIIDPKSDEELERKNHYAKKYWETRKRRGITLYDAQTKLRERNYYAAMMVNEGDADAVITGYSRSYPASLKPMMELIGTYPGTDRIATCNLMMTERGPIFMADSGINIDPTAKDLIKIVRMTSNMVKMFGIEAHIAMLSYSNFGSSDNQKADKVREAVDFLHRHYPYVSVDGGLQADFALNPEMLKSKFPFSTLVGKKVNTLVFPNLDAANIAYKLIKQLNGTQTVGPIMLGMRKPVHILQLGAGVDEIVNMTAVAVVDAQEKEKREQGN